MIKLALIITSLSTPVFGGTASFENQLGSIRQQLLPDAGDQQRKTAFMRTAADKSNGQDERVAAIKELKKWVSADNGVAALLQEIALDQEDLLAVRVRALKTLGMAISIPSKQYENTLAVLLEISRDERVPMPARVMAVKALHWANSIEGWVRREMIIWTAPSRPVEFKVASLWALASGVSKDAEVERILTDFIERRSLDLRMRIQALKSLYPIAEKDDVFRRVMAMVGDTSEPVELRETAALFLSGAKGRDEVRVFLENATRLADQRVGDAAKKALDGTKIQELWVYFRLRYDPIRHNFIDVLELE